MVIESALAATLFMSLQAAPPAAAPEAPPAPESTVATETARAEPAAPAAQVAQEEAAVDEEDKVICRRTAVVGSRFKKRICGTAREWTTLRGESKDVTRRLQRSGRGLDPNGG